MIAAYITDIIKCTRDTRAPQRVPSAHASTCPVSKSCTRALQTIPRPLHDAFAIGMSNVQVCKCMCACVCACVRNCFMSHRYFKYRTKLKEFQPCEHLLYGSQCCIPLFICIDKFLCITHVSMYLHEYAPCAIFSPNKRQAANSC
jgi:hypothetical protein